LWPRALCGPFRIKGGAAAHPPPSALDSLNLNIEVYDAITGECGSCLKWFCESCEKEVTDSNSECATSKSAEKLDKIMDLQQKFMDMLGNLDARIDMKADVDVGMQLQTQIRSMEDRLLKFEDRTTINDEKIHNLKLRSLRRKWMSLAEREVPVAPVTI